MSIEATSEGMEYVQAGIVVRGDLSLEQLNFIGNRIDRELREAAKDVAAFLGSDVQVWFKGERVV